MYARSPSNRPFAKLWKVLRECAAYSGHSSIGQAPARRDQTATRFSLQLAEEADHGGVDLGGALLLGPMPAAGQHDGAAQLRHITREVGDRLVHVPKRHHQVAVAGHVERGNIHFGAGKRSQELPVAVDVAVPVEAAAKSGPRELV